MSAASTLSRSERHLGFSLAVGLALLGLMMAAGAGHGVMAFHGAVALALGMLLVFRIGGALYDSEPDAGRLNQYGSVAKLSRLECLLQ